MDRWLKEQFQRWKPAATWLRSQLPLAPKSALIAGSGVSAALSGELLWECPYAALPGFPRPTVEGHPGVIQLRLLGAEVVLVFGGRMHLYEGYELSEVVSPVVCAAILGIRWLILTNAAGSLSTAVEPGSIFLVRDVLNLSFQSLPVGWELRQHYHRCLCPRWRRRVRDRLAQQGYVCPEGTYAAVLGPSYETPAEVRMLQCIGADVVGMSTVHELQCATALGMTTLVLSVVTNWAAGLQPHPLSHAEVVSVLHRSSAALCRFLEIAFSTTQNG